MEATPQPPHDEARTEAGGSPPKPRLAWLEWPVVLCVLSLAFVSLAWPLFGMDPSREVPQFAPHTAVEGAAAYRFGRMSENDHRFVVWLVARNAHALVTDPLHIFDSEACAPIENGLAMSEPVITLGLLGLPAEIVSGDPIVVYNFALLVFLWLGAIAMYLLVREWTGLPSAGLVAALAYGFHELRLWDVVHIFIFDTTWTVLALFFATRLVKRGGVGSAIGLAICAALQIGESFYPLLVAIAFGLFFVIFAWRAWGPGELRAWHVGLLVVVVAVAGAFVLGPFLGKSESGDLPARGVWLYRPLRWLLPGEAGFVGWIMLALMIVALTPLGRRATSDARANPRFYVLGCGVLLAVLSVHVGGTSSDIATVVRDEAGKGWHPFQVLARIVPGFDVVRGPGSIYAGAHLAWSLLAGLGAATVVRAVPPARRPMLAAATVALVFLDTLRPAALGLEPRVRYVPFEIAPAEEEIRFFEVLAERGDAGPILELPTNAKNPAAATRALVLAAYHHRKTAQCYNANHAIRDVHELAARLPDADAFDALAEKGFTTVIIRKDAHDLLAPHRRELFERFERSALGRSRLERLVDTPYATAWALHRPS